MADVALPDPDAVQAGLRAAKGDLARLYAQHRDPARALHHFALLQWRAGQLAAACDALLAALALGPDDAGAWRDLAAVSAGAGEMGRAVLCAREALGLAPEEAQSWLLFASLLEGRDEPAAEDAFVHALDLDPGLSEAHLGLGALCLRQLRLPEAVTHLRTMPLQAEARSMLGRALYLTGDFAAAAAAYTEAAALAPLDPVSQHTRRRAVTLQRLIEDSGEAALAAYREAEGEAAYAAFLIEAYASLSAFGHREAALLVARQRAAASPGDREAAYLLDVASGKPLAAPPADYVREHYDRFAAAFDHKLVDILHYRVPEALADLIAGHRRDFTEILDLGCGTGLAAEPLARFGARLVGVDLSAAMLARAAARGRYADLVEAEAAAYLAGQTGRFDLIVAADLLICIGRLETLVDRAASALRDGGILALSIERAARGDFAVLPSGRFAHAEAYVERLAAPRFTPVARVAATIRLEAGRPVAGSLMLFRKAAAEYPCPGPAGRHRAAADPCG